MYDTRLNPESDWTTHVRAAARSDREMLADLLDRCSAETRRRRFGGFVRQWPEAFLRDCLAGQPARHDALVLVTRSRDETRVSGLASAATVAAMQDGSVAEISLLVEDAWQRSGAGAMLLDELLYRAWRRGVRQIVFQVDAEQLWLTRWASRQLAVTRSYAERGTLHVEGGLSGERWADRCRGPTAHPAQGPAGWSSTAASSTGPSSWATVTSGAASS